MTAQLLDRCLVEKDDSCVDRVKILHILTKPNFLSNLKLTLILLTWRIW